MSSLVTPTHIVASLMRWMALDSLVSVSMQGLVDFVHSNALIVAAPLSHDGESLLLDFGIAAWTMDRASESLAGTFTMVRADNPALSAKDALALVDAAQAATQSSAPSRGILLLLCSDFVLDAVHASDLTVVTSGRLPSSSRYWIAVGWCNLPSAALMPSVLSSIPPQPRPASWSDAWLPRSHVLVCDTDPAAAVACSTALAGGDSPWCTCPRSPTDAWKRSLAARALITLDPDHPVPLCLASRHARIPAQQRWWLACPEFPALLAPPILCGKHARLDRIRRRLAAIRQQRSLPALACNPCWHSLLPALDAANSWPETLRQLGDQRWLCLRPTSSPAAAEGPPPSLEQHPLLWLSPVCGAVVAAGAAPHRLSSALQSFGWNATDARTVVAAVADSFLHVLPDVLDRQRKALSGAFAAVSVAPAWQVFPAGVSAPGNATGGSAPSSPSGTTVSGGVPDSLATATPISQQPSELDLLSPSSADLTAASVSTGPSSDAVSVDDLDSDGRSGIGGDPAASVDSDSSSSRHNSHDVPSDHAGPARDSDDDSSHPAHVTPADFGPHLATYLVIGPLRSTPTVTQE